MRAVSSVLQQKSCRFEIIVSDDSEDDSVEKVMRECARHPELRYFKNPARMGATANWNTSMERATGRIIKVLHHDDWLDNELSLAAMVEPILQGQASIVFCACRQMSVSGAQLGIHRAGENQLRQLTAMPEILALGNFVGGPSVCTFDASSGIQAFNPQYTWLADLEFFIRILRIFSGRFTYLDEPLVNVTADSPAQITRFYESHRLDSVLENVRLFSANRNWKVPPERVRSYFYELGLGLDFSQIVPAVRAALGAGDARIALLLTSGYVRRLSGV